MAAMNPIDWGTAGKIISQTGTGASAGAGAGSIIPGLGTGIGALIGGVGGLGLGIYDAIMGRKDHDYNKENIEWEKQMTLMNWLREDNAIQRSMTDLKAAGLNPLMAIAGPAESTSPASPGTLTTPSAKSALGDMKIAEAFMAWEQIKGIQTQNAYNNEKLKQARIITEELPNQYNLKQQGARRAEEELGLGYERGRREERQTRVAERGARREDSREQREGRRFTAERYDRQIDNTIKLLNIEYQTLNNTEKRIATEAKQALPELTRQGYNYHAILQRFNVNPNSKLGKFLLTLYDLNQMRSERAAEKREEERSQRSNK